MRPPGRAGRRGACPAAGTRSTRAGRGGRARGVPPAVARGPLVERVGAGRALLRELAQRALGPVAVALAVPELKVGRDVATALGEAVPQREAVRQVVAVRVVVRVAVARVEHRAERAAVRGEPEVAAAVVLEIEPRLHDDGVERVQRPLEAAVEALVAVAVVRAGVLAVERERVLRGRVLARERLRILVVGVVHEQARAHREPGAPLADVVRAAGVGRADAALLVHEETAGVEPAAAEAAAHAAALPATAPRSD